MTALRCWNATTDVGSSWTLETASFAPAPRVTSSVPVNRLGPTVDLLARRDELLEDRRLGAVAELDDRPGDERPVRRPDRPAEDDRLVELDAGRDPQDHAVAPAGAGQLREAVVLGQRAGSGDQPFGRRVPDEVAERLERHPGGGDAGIEGERPTRSSLERRQTGGPGIGLGHGRAARARSRAIGRTGRRRRGPRSAGRRTSCTAGSSRSAAPRTGRRRRVGRRSARPARRRSAPRGGSRRIERELCGGSAGGTDA